MMVLESIEKAMNTLLEEFRSVSRRINTIESRHNRLMQEKRLVWLSTADIMLLMGFESPKTARNFIRENLPYVELNKHLRVKLLDFERHMETMLLQEHEKEERLRELFHKRGAA